MNLVTEEENLYPENGSFSIKVKYEPFKKFGDLGAKIKDVKMANLFMTEKSSQFLRLFREKAPQKKLSQHSRRSILMK